MRFKSTVPTMWKGYKVEVIQNVHRLGSHDIIDVRVNSILQEAMRELKDIISDYTEYDIDNVVLIMLFPPRVIGMATKEDLLFLARTVTIEYGYVIVKEE